MKSMFPTFQLDIQVEAKVIGGVIHYRPPFSEVWLQAHGNILAQIAHKIDPSSKNHNELAAWVKRLPK